MAAAAALADSSDASRAFFVNMLTTACRNALFENKSLSLFAAVLPGRRREAGILCSVAFEFVKNSNFDKVDSHELQSRERDDLCASSC